MSYIIEQHSPYVRRIKRGSKIVVQARHNIVAEWQDKWETDELVDMHAHNNSIKRAEGIDLAIHHTNEDRRYRVARYEFPGGHEMLLIAQNEYAAIMMEQQRNFVEWITEWMDY